MDKAKIDSAPRQSLSDAIAAEPIRTFMNSDPLLMPLGMPVLAVLDEMRRHRSSCALICDATKLVGIFTERDFLDRVAGEPDLLERPIEECMSANPTALAPSDTLRSLLETIVGGGYRHLPVVEDGVVLGLVAALDIVKYIADLFPGEVYNLPPQLDQVMPRMEGA